MNNNYDSIRFVTDRSKTQRGVQLNDGRIISLFDDSNNFYLRFDDVIDLVNGIVVRRSDGTDISQSEIDNGYTTLNIVIGNHQGNEVFCYDEAEFCLDIYRDDYTKINTSEIVDFFRSKGYNVTTDAVYWCIENWKCGLKGGYRDEKNGYHLFNPSGGNIFSIRLTTLCPLCKDWQETYYC